MSFLIQSNDYFCYEWVIKSFASFRSMANYLLYFSLICCKFSFIPWCMCVFPLWNWLRIIGMPSLSVVLATFYRLTIFYLCTRMKYNISRIGKSQIVYQVRNAGLDSHKDVSSISLTVSRSDVSGRVMIFIFIQQSFRDLSSLFLD